MSQQIPRYRRQAAHFIHRIQKRQQRPFVVTLDAQRCLSSSGSVSSSAVHNNGGSNSDCCTNTPILLNSTWATAFKLRRSSIHWQHHQPMHNNNNNNNQHLDGSTVRWFSSGDDDEANKSKEENKEEKKDDKEEKPADDAPKEEEKPPGEADAKKENDTPPPAEKTEDAKKEEDDDCPPWQNPLIEKDPDNEKIFAEDFAPGEEMPTVPVPPLEDPNNPDKILASPELYDLADDIVHLSMLEMKELVTKIGDHFGFEQPPFAGSGGGGGGGGGDGGDDDEGGDGAEAAAAAKTAFDIKLLSFDPKSKIKVIKEVRAIAGLGLKEAKELVEGAPKVVMKDISKEQAEELQKKLEEAGATVEIV